MRLTPFRLALVLGTASALTPACLAQNPPDAMTPDPTAPVADPSQIEPAPPLDPGQTSATPPAPTPQPPATPPPAPDPPAGAPPPAPAPTTPSTTPSVKPPDPLANVLGQEFKMLGYGIRPPKGYTYTVVPIQDVRRRDFIWQGTLHQDGYVTTLVVGIQRVSDPKPNSSSEFLVGYYKGMAKTLTDPVLSASQPVSVSGMSALRATWAGTLVTKHSRLKLQGLIYVIQDGTIRVAVVGTDSVPYFTTTFAALNAATLSIHK